MNNAMLGSGPIGTSVTGVAESSTSRQSNSIAGSISRAEGGSWYLRSPSSFPGSVMPMMERVMVTLFVRIGEVFRDQSAEDVDPLHSGDGVIDAGVPTKRLVRATGEAYDSPVLSAFRDAFVGDGELTERQGSLLVVGAGTVFSVTAISVAAVDKASSFQFLTYRGASTALAMVALILVRRGGRPVSFAGVTRTVWLAGFTLGGTSMLYILALSRTSAATTLFLLAAAPVFAALLGWIFLRERVERSTLLAIGATMVGVAITVSAGLEVGSVSGLLFAGGIPVTIGLYSVLMRSVSGVDPVIPTLIAGSVLCVASAALALTQGGLGVSLRDGALACVSGGIALGLGLPMFNLGHRSVPAARVPLLLMTEVVLAPLWVWIWPGETPGVATLIGGAVILGAVVWLMLVSKHTPDAVPSSRIASIPVD
jgi:DME family drug/metabolite transporter